MQVRFTQNLGILDIAAIKHKHGIELDAKDCKQGSTTDLPQKAVEFLTAKYGSKQALFEPVNVKGESKKPELTAPAK